MAARDRVGTFQAPQSSWRRYPFSTQAAKTRAAVTCGGDEGIIAGDVRCVGSLDEPGDPAAASPTCRQITFKHNRASRPLVRNSGDNAHIPTA